LSQRSKRILGVDPGLTHSGFGIVDLCGNTITYVESGSIGIPDQNLKIPDRIKYHFLKLGEIIERVQPNELALEAIFYARNVRMAIELAHIRGALILAAKLKNMPVYEYSPLEIKQAVVGYGKASKDQVHKMVKTILKRQELKDSHASDALAAAICHSNTGTLSSRIRDLMT
jgi:crossover junction endodeoxyribonuclease RuvC